MYQKQQNLSYNTSVDSECVWHNFFFNYNVPGFLLCQKKKKSNFILEWLLNTICFVFFQWKGHEHTQRFHSTGNQKQLSFNIYREAVICKTHNREQDVILSCSLNGDNTCVIYQMHSYFLINILLHIFT